MFHDVLYVRMERYYGRPGRGRLLISEDISAKEKNKELRCGLYIQYMNVIESVETLHVCGREPMTLRPTSHIRTTACGEKE